MIRIITILIATLLTVYLVFVTFFFKEERRTDICKRMEVVVKDSLEKHFVTESDLITLLKKENLDPVGKPMTEINTDEIEQCLLGNEMISDIQAYKTPSGIIKLEVKQKVPILRVMSTHGNFYVDNNGTTMPISQRYVVHVPIASGHIEKERAITDLYKFALFLQKEDFWNAQIEQIYVRLDGDIELIPRVGNHRIILGQLDEYKEKLEKLRLFYDRVIPKMGWEKYHIINLKYRNQIVCTKGDKI